MAAPLRRRLVASTLAGAVLAASFGLLLPSSASAATTSLFNQPFHNRTADGDGAVVLPAGAGGAANTACLTVNGNTSSSTTTPISCAAASGYTADAQGAGKLRLTDASNSKAGGLFAATSVPATGGLDVKFNSYQWGGNAADGITFSLAAVDPTNPLAPANTGAVGGALGYSPGNGVNGLAYGYLGVGLDVFGNFSNSTYQGSGCTNPAYISTTGQVKGQVLVRGPGNLKVGYCALASTATSTTSAAIALRATTRAASKVPVNVVTNPGAGSITTTSGVTVEGKSYAVVFTPVGATTPTTLKGLLPKVTSPTFPANWIDANGYPKQLAFGFVASTGGSTDNHEIDETTISSLSAVPELNVAQTSYTQPAPAIGDPVTYVVTAGVESGIDETAAVSVTDTLPPGVTPGGGFGTGWVCGAPSGQKITCTNSNGPFTAGTKLPKLTITGTVTAAGVTPATIAANSIVTASSNDANPAYANTAATGTPSVAPSNLALTPTSGPSGTATTVTGTDITSATAIQIGTADEIAAGTASTLNPCPNNVAAAGCFTVSGSTLSISAMPAHVAGAVVVKVVNLGSSASTSYTYTSAPGAPAVTATAGTTSAAVSWTVPPSNGSAITGYTLTPYKAGVAQTPISYGPGVTSVTLTGLTAKSSYTFAVTATSSLGTGPAGTSAAVTPYTLASAPTIGTPTAGTSSATVKWTAPGDNGGAAVTGYVVTPYLANVAQTPQSFASTATSQVVTGLTPGSAYTFTVAAVNPAGTGPASARSTAVTVNDAPTITSTPPKGDVGVAYSHQVTTSGGTAPSTFALSSGALPTGLTLSTAGLLSGTPTAVGSFTYEVKVTDASNATAVKSFTTVIAAAPSLTFTPALPRAQVGTAYSQPLGYTGGTGPYTFSVSAGTLPAGVTLNASTGVLSGTPTTGGDYAFTIKIVDSVGGLDTRSATLEVRALPGAPTIGRVSAGSSSATVRWTAPTDAGTSPITGYVVTPYLNGVAQPTQTFESTALTQLVTGLTPGSAYTFAVAAITDVGTGPLSARSTSVTVNNGPAITSVPPAGEVTVAYSEQLTTVGGTGPFTFLVSSGALPAGLTLSASGLIAGTPTTAGSSVYQVRVTDSSNATSTRSFTTVIATAPALTFTRALPRGDVGTAYSEELSYSGGTGPFTFSVTAGTLPAGLTLDPDTGVLAGTPTASGDYGFTVKILDAFGLSDTRAGTLSVRDVPGAPTIGTVTAGTSSATVRWTAPTDTGNSPVTGYVVTPFVRGVAQTARTFDSTATSQVVTGLTGGGSYTFTVKAVNAVGVGAPSAASTAVTVNSVPLISSTPPKGDVGVAYSHQLTTTGGTGPFTFSAGSGSLPDGVSLSGAGLLSGTPTATGSFTYQVQVTDASGVSSATTFTTVVAAAPKLTFTPAQPRGEVGSAYSQELSYTGGSGPFTFSVTTGTLPAGLTLNTSTGVVSGTPTADGDYAFTVKIVDAAGGVDTRNATLVVRGVPAAPTIGRVTAGSSSATVRWTAPTDTGNSPITGYVVTPYLNGVAQLTQTFESTALTQLVTALTPKQAYTFAVAAINALGTGPLSAQSAAVTVNEGPAITSVPAGGEVSVAYSEQLSIDGGTGPFTFTLASGTLPTGLTISGAGLISGTPTADGSFTYRVRVTDSSNATSARSFTTVIAAAPVLTFTPALPKGEVGTAYSQPLSHTGGTGPYAFSVSAGTLPAGLTLDPGTGVLTGTPTASGNYAFTVRIVDSFGVADTKAATLAVQAVPGAPTIGTVTAGTSSATVRWTAPTATGNSPVTGYVVTPFLGGVAQPAQTFGSTATTQTVTGLNPGGVYTFTVKAVNAVGTGAPSAESGAVTINDAPVVTSTPPRGEVGADYSHRFTVTGGTGPIVYTVSAGSLPDGLTLSGTGALTGTPTDAGSSTFTIKATDASDATATKVFTVVIAARPTLTFTSPLDRGDVGTAYSTTFTRTGGTGPFEFSLLAGTLPAGLSLDPDTGVLSGTPTAGGSYAFTIEVEDAFDQSDTKAATLVVRAAADVRLASSVTSTPFGRTVTLTGTVDPSDAGGTVTFVDTPATGPDAGTVVTLGSDSISNGVASLTVTLPSFGAHTIVARYGGDVDHLAGRSGSKVVEVTATVGEAVITEFRTSGPAGAGDEYAEIYNTGPAVPLAGFVLRSSAGAITLPASAPTLGTNRTYLVTGSDFSLGAFATSDLTGDLGVSGLRLIAPDTAGTITDETGPSASYHFGTALPTLSGTPNEQYAFVRIETSGRPNNTGSNRADFALVSSTGGVVGGVQSMRGSASPTGLGDPWQHNDQAKSFLLGTGQGVNASPNREYVAGTPGKLTLRRTITNTGPTTITGAKVRVTAMSEANGLPYYGGPAPAKVALIRAVNPSTTTSQVAVPGRGTVTVQNLRIDTPITAAAGGGLNTTMTVPLPGGGLAPGASIDVAFTFDVDTKGTFWFGYDVDATTSQAQALKSKASKMKLASKLESAGKAPSEAAKTVVKGTL